MVNIGILSHINIIKSGVNFFYPLFRWKNEIYNAGYNITFYNSHIDSRLYKHDIVIIIHRYFHQLLGNTVIKDKSIIVDFLENLRSNGVKVIFFDAGDSSGSRELDLVEHCDLFLKKQVWKDRNAYLHNNGDKSVRPWLSEFDTASIEYYKPCHPDHLQKIDIGWNIGMADYRRTPRIFTWLYTKLFWQPKWTSSESTREINTVYRGSLNKENAYAEQRNKLLNILNKSDNKGGIIGGKVGKKKYLMELANSKFSISPFGWGEICYRDFEIIIAGSCLVKPDMSHLETWPDIFFPNETYIPVKWDLSDIEAVLEYLQTNRNFTKKIAKNAQISFKADYNNRTLFVQRFKNLVEKCQS